MDPREASGGGFNPSKLGAGATATVAEVLSI